MAPSLACREPEQASSGHSLQHPWTDTEPPPSQAPLPHSAGTASPSRTATSPRISMSPIEVVALLSTANLRSRRLGKSTATRAKMEQKISKTGVGLMVVQECGLLDIWRGNSLARGCVTVMCHRVQPRFSSSATFEAFHFWHSKYQIKHAGGGQPKPTTSLTCC
jgi:hypothetical protein